MQGLNLDALPEPDQQSHLAAFELRVNEQGDTTANHVLTPIDPLRLPVDVRAAYERRRQAGIRLPLGVVHRKAGTDFPEVIYGNGRSEDELAVRGSDPRYGAPLTMLKIAVVGCVTSMSCGVVVVLLGVGGVRVPAILGTLSAAALGVFLLIGMAAFLVGEGMGWRYRRAGRQVADGLREYVISEDSIAKFAVDEAKELRLKRSRAADALRKDFLRGRQADLRNLRATSPESLAEVRSIIDQRTARREKQLAELVADARPDRAIQIALASAEIVDSIKCSSAWNSDLLAPHRQRWNPETELLQIRQHALQIASLRTGTQPTGSDDAELQRVHTEQNRVLDTLEDSLMRRGAALQAYCSQVKKLSAEIERLNALDQAAQRNAVIGNLSAQILDDELAADRLSRLAFETEALSELITTYTEALTGMLPNPELSA